MHSIQDMSSLLANLNALVGGLFMITSFAIVATRQTQACLKYFLWQSAFLAASAFLLGANPLSIDLMAVAAINLATKLGFLPWILRQLLKEEVFTRREITQAVSIPTSLIIALVLTIAAYFFSLPWLKTVVPGSAPYSNVPVGLTGLLLGAYTLTTRREAVPQLLGLLAMENGAFFAGVAIAPDLPLIAELALAFDLLILTFVVGVLTRTVHKRIGNTAVGALDKLREQEHR